MVQIVYTERLNGFTKTGVTSNFVAGVTGTFENGIMAPNTFATSGNWSTASNWSLGIVPTQVDEVTIASGQTVTIDVDDLTIDDFTLENYCNFKHSKRQRNYHSKLICL